VQCGLLSRRADRFPDVIGIGAEKCGTTSLHHYLTHHPQLGVQRIRETSYFDPRRNWHRGPSWYQSQFPAGPKVLMETHGGGYTNYPLVEGVPERIHSQVPNARFVYLVRDPIERMISQWVHRYSNSVEPLSLDEALDRPDTDYVWVSSYGRQLEKYLPFYPIDRFHVLTHEDLLERRYETLEKLFRFIGVDPAFHTDRFHVLHHSSSRKRRNTPAGMMLQRTIGDRIFRHLRDSQKHWFKMIVYGPVSQRIERPTLDPGVRARLRELFRPDVRRLEEITARRYSRWLA
jgi:hypothetical protein